MVDDWSVEGCRIVNYDGPLRPGRIAIVDILLFVDHGSESLPAIAEVVRFEPENNNALALHYRELRPRDFKDYCDRVEDYLAAQVDEESDPDEPTEPDPANRSM